MKITFELHQRLNQAIDTRRDEASVVVVVLWRGVWSCGVVVCKV